LPIGNTNFEWDGTNQTGSPLPNGIYLLRLNGKQMVKTEKLILLND
jgi:flagellar hook assembly protein FlgD